MARKKPTKAAVQVPGIDWDEVYPGGFDHRDEANALIALAVRNGPIEDLHAGKWSPLLEDKTLSRITDEEMKALMINATEHLAKLLRMRDEEPGRYREYVRAYGSMYCRSWERDRQRPPKKATDGSTAAENAT